MLVGVKSGIGMKSAAKSAFGQASCVVAGQVGLATDLGLLATLVGEASFSVVYDLNSNSKIKKLGSFS